MSRSSPMYKKYQLIYVPTNSGVPTKAWIFPFPSSQRSLAAPKSTNFISLLSLLASTIFSGYKEVVDLCMLHVGMYVGIVCMSLTFGWWYIVKRWIRERTSPEIKL